jgi:hypothetical protein
MVVGGVLTEILDPPVIAYRGRGTTRKVHGGSSLSRLQQEVYPLYRTAAYTTLSITIFDTVIQAWHTFDRGGMWSGRPKQKLMGLAGRKTANRPLHAYSPIAANRQE